MLNLFDEQSATIFNIHYLKIVGTYYIQESYSIPKLKSLVYKKIKLIVMLIII